MALKELQEKRQQLAANIKELADKFNANGKKWTGEDESAWTNLNNEYDANKKELDAELASEKKRNEDEAAIQARLDAIAQDAAKPNYDALLGRDEPKDAGDRGGKELSAADTHALAIQGWLRATSGDDRAGEVTNEHVSAAKKCGIRLNSNSIGIPLFKNFREARANFRNTLGDKDGASGGYTYGESFVAQLERAMLAYGGMFDVASIIRTASGEPMRWPTANDTSNTGRQLGESTAVTTTTDPTFAQVIWNSYKFSSDCILVPYELLRDSAFDLAAELSQMLGERLGRIQNTKFTTGSGAGTAKGIVTASTLGVTAASATAIAFDELIDLEHSIDPSRRRMPGVGYMFHDTILKAFRKLKDGTGRYLWQAGANSGAPDTLNTYPYTVNQDMQSSIATATKTVLFGQLSQYKIRQVATMRMYRLQERYRDNDQDGFVAFIEGDGNLLDAGDHPVKHLLQA